MLAVSIFIVVCSAGAALTIVNEPTNDSSSRVAATQVTTNPAGCVAQKTSSSLEQLGGVFPVDEFKDMLATRTGMVWRNNQKDYGLSEQLKLPWCPEPSSDSVFTHEDSDGFSYLEEQLAGINKSDPMVLTVAEVFISAGGDYHTVQTTNFLCGLRRLGLAQNTAVFVTDERTQTFLRQQFPDIKVLWHPALLNAMRRIGLRTGVPRVNRIAKLVLASMLVEQGREVVVTDLDMYWSQNPIDYLRALRSPDGLEVEFAAMKDFCWLELNSGFLYYKSTTQTKELLHTALSTKKFSGMFDGYEAALLADNDQYLLNCALARSATRGMRYTVVPRSKFLFVGPGSCRRESDPAPEAPLVWHTAGFSTNYEKELDTFAVTGLLDLDARSGQCFAGARGSASAVAEYENKWSRLCRSDAGGIGAPTCSGICAGSAPSIVSNILSQYKSGWQKEVSSQRSRSNSREVQVTEDDFSDSDRPAPSE